MGEYFLIKNVKKKKTKEYCEALKRKTEEKIELI